MASRSLGEIRQNRYTVGFMELRQGAIPPPEITLLTQDEVRRLFAVITSKRDRALFHLAYHHGLRASEVSLLQRDNVHEKQGRIYIPRVKGSIATTYPLQPEDLRLVRAYLRTREDDSPSLFISTRGLPLERRSYWDLMQKYGQGAAIPKPKRRFRPSANKRAKFQVGFLIRPHSEIG